MGWVVNCSRIKIWVVVGKRARLLAPGYISPLLQDADGFRADDTYDLSRRRYVEGTTWRGHQGWVKLRTHMTAIVRGGRAGLTAGMRLFGVALPASAREILDGHSPLETHPMPVANDTFGRRITFDPTPGWGRPLSLCEP